MGLIEETNIVGFLRFAYFSLFNSNVIILCLLAQAYSVFIFLFLIHNFEFTKKISDVLMNVFYDRKMINDLTN